MDARDRRPLEYPIRLGFPMDEDKKNQHKSIWCKSSLFLNNRTVSRAKMLATKEMKLVESDDALPNTTDEAIHSPAEKYSQIGDGTAAVLLDSVLNPISPGPKSVAVVLDLSPRTGDFARSVMRKFGTWNFSIHYAALAVPEEMEWMQGDLSDLGLDLFLSGALNITNHKPLPEFPPQSDQPTLSEPVLNLGRLDGLNLVLGEEIGKKWSGSSMAAKWTDLMTRMNEMVPPKSEAGPSPSKKLRLDEPSGSAPEASSCKLVSLKDLDITTVLLQANGVGKLKGLNYQLFPNHCLYLCNPTDSEVALSGNTFLTGWHKGKWWQPGNSENKDGELIEENSEVDIPWDIKSSTTVLLLDAKVGPKTLWTIMEEKKNKEPEKAVLRYHALVDKASPDAVSDFEPKVQKLIFWRAELAKIEKNTNSNSLAALFPAHAWDDDVTHVVWNVRWSKNGLCGLKPLVYLKVSVILKPGMAIKLTT